MPCVELGPSHGDFIMGTIQAGTSAGMRIKSGAHVIARSETVDTSPIKSAFRSFLGIQKSYSTSDAKVQKASAQVIKAERAFGESDAAQDSGVGALALAYVNAGAKLSKPFEGLGVGTPREIINKDALKEAKLVIKLAGIAEKHADAGVRKAAAAAKKAATAVLAAEKPIIERKKTRAQMMTVRDGLALQWEKAFASLKLAARASDDANGTKLFEALFSEA